MDYSPEILKLEAEGLNLEKPEAMAEFIISEIGGIGAGLWKKEIILDNNIFFPEHLKYEDNFWGTLIKAYLKKIALVHDFGYFYRNNPTSTTHHMNPPHLRDRVIIENKLLNEAKRRGLFELYYSAWEYIYIYRYAFNSSMHSASRRTVDYELVKKVFADLNYEFPNWRHNKYYLKGEASLKRKVYRSLCWISTVFAAFVSHVLHRLRDYVMPQSVSA